MIEIPFDLQKRYWLFFIPMHQTDGGLQDIIGTFDSVEAANSYNDTYMTYANSHSQRYVFDATDRQIASVNYKKIN